MFRSDADEPSLPDPCRSRALDSMRKRKQKARKLGLSSTFTGGPSWIRTMDLMLIKHAL